MLLIGQYDSPFVRRVAIALRLYGLKFQHKPWSTFGDAELIAPYNPLRRVPTLVLDDGEVLSDSAAILDYLDQRVGVERALLPASGRARRESLRLMAIALAAAEKGRDQLQEVFFRPDDKRHLPWIERLQSQMHAGVGLLDNECKSRNTHWLIGSAMSQADITATCAFTFLNDALPDAGIATRYPHAAKLVARCETLAPFQDTHTPFFKPVA